MQTHQHLNGYFCGFRKYISKWNLLAKIAFLILVSLSIIVGNGQPTFAATSPASELPILESNLASNIDRFLTNIPSGFFTVSSVESLKGILLDRPQTMIIDVREPSEYRSGHIPKAINMPIRTLSSHLQEIPRDRPVILYCSTGYRSAMGIMTLQLLGYENVRGFTPSYAGWRMAGEAIAKS